MAWLEKQLAAFPGRSEVKLRNASDATGAVAVQGPRVVEFIDEVLSRARPRAARWWRG